jgi:hypothetical protein
MTEGLPLYTRNSEELRGRDDLVELRVVRS